jgi:hypothetical protein
MEMHALIEELGALLQKIKSGNATLGELEAFAAAAAQLNEKAIVLRYKAYETKVHGEQNTAVETPVQEEIELPKMEALTEEVDIETASDSFDLFSLDESPEETMSFEIAIEEEPVETTPLNETETTETTETIAPIQLENSEEIASEQTDIQSQEPVFESEREQPNSSTESNEELHTIYSKLNTNDGSLASRLMSVRLETLKGAFGFNERLQIIQELFRGSNEEFSQLIEQLEETPSKERARFLVSAYAMKFDWDAENPLALELIQKVERKYA